MSYFPANNFLLEVAKGNVPKHSLIHKFGSNLAVGTTFVPVAQGGIYQMPQPAGATALRIKAGNTNDTAAGSGAREITLQGLDETGALATEALATAGTSASSTTTTTFIRLFRAWVSASGTYATASAASHAADIVIETSGGTAWTTITVSGFGHAQTEIGFYTIPLGFTGYFLGGGVYSDTTKTTEAILFKREGVIETAVPYEAMRQQHSTFVKGSGEASIHPETAIGGYTGPADIGFMAKVDAGTALVEVDFQILLVAD